MATKADSKNNVSYHGFTIGDKVVVNLGFSEFAGGLVTGVLKEVTEKGILVGKQFLAHSQVKEIGAF